ncbi:MAG: membrane protein [Actinomycetota bacterium]|nr:MAG: membrane protein [Actinomycetota bacterium]
MASTTIQRSAAPTELEGAARTERPKGAIAFGLTRIAIGWLFLWAFLDKAFALGFATGRAEDGSIDFFAKGQAWLNGGSPTEGVLRYATKGPLAGFFQSLAGAAWVDWVYMLSMLLIGGALVLGVATRLAAVGGAIWMALFYLATSIWPEYNPVVDDHIVYILVLVGLAQIGAGRYLGLQERWERSALVRRFPVLR